MNPRNKPSIKTRSACIILCANLLRVPVEEEIRHDVPGKITTDGTTKTKNFTTKEPPHQPQGILALQVHVRRSMYM